MKRFPAKLPPPQRDGELVEYSTYEPQVGAKLDYTELCAGCALLRKDGSCKAISKSDSRVFYGKDFYGYYHDSDDLAHSTLPLSKDEIISSLKKAQKVLRQNPSLRKKSDNELFKTKDVLHLNKISPKMQTLKTVLTHVAILSNPIGWVMNGYRYFMSNSFTEDARDAYKRRKNLAIEGTPIGKSVLKQVLRKDCAAKNPDRQSQGATARQQTMLAQKITNGEIDLSKLTNPDDLR